MLKGKRKRSEQPEDNEDNEGEENESYNIIEFKKAGFSKYQKTDQDFNPQIQTLPISVSQPA